MIVATTILGDRGLIARFLARGEDLYPADFFEKTRQITEILGDFASSIQPGIRNSGQIVAMSHDFLAPSKGR